MIFQEFSHMKKGEKLAIFEWDFSVDRKGWESKNTWSIDSTWFHQSLGGSSKSKNDHHRWVTLLLVLFSSAHFDSNSVNQRWFAVKPAIYSCCSHIFLISYDFSRVFPWFSHRNSHRNSHVTKAHAGDSRASKPVPSDGLGSLELPLGLHLDWKFMGMGILAWSLMCSNPSIFWKSCKKLEVPMDNFRKHMEDRLGAMGVFVNLMRVCRGICNGISTMILVFADVTLLYGKSLFFWR